MRREPIRHHYIPQFILRNFACDNEKKLVCYYDKESQSVLEREICEIFMERNFYRDEINYKDKPVQIEYDLSVLEREVSELIKEKFLDKRKFELSEEEGDVIKLFFAIMAFRNIHAKEQFGDRSSKESKEFYKHFQKDENLEDFWKRNLGHLVKCRSMNDVANHPEIDPPIKLFMSRDTNALYGKYIIVVEPRDGNGFILGNCYPLAFAGDYLRLPLYDVCPISPNRAIIIASKGVEHTPRDVLSLRPGVFDFPEINENGNSVIVTKRLLLDEVQFINREIEKNSHKGFIFSKFQQKGSLLSECATYLRELSDKDAEPTSEQKQRILRKIMCSTIQKWGKNGKREME